MRLTLLSASYRTMPLELREKLAFANEHLAQAGRDLVQRYPGAEFVILSTCNRTEIYTAHPSNEPPEAEDLRQFLSDSCQVSIEDLTQCTVHRENEQAVSHLFRVASGLESMVLGEAQILGQVKRSYETACQQRGVGPTLHRLFQQAITTAKHVRLQTGIDEGRTSIASTAVSFAQQIFDHFGDKVVVGIGAGEMAEVTLRHLQALHPKKLWLANRTRQRAADIVDHLNITVEQGGVRNIEDLDQLLVEADVVISSTGSPDPIITVEQLKPILKKRRFKPLFLLDIAVPRDIEAAVSAMRNVYLYNIDDLQQVVEQTHSQRAEHVQAAEELIGKDMRACMSQIQHRDVGQLIRQLRQKLTDIGELELERTRRKLQSTTPENMPDLVGEHTHRVINKILHLPLSQIDHRHPDAPLAFYAAALRRLFELDGVDENQPTPPPSVCPRKKEKEEEQKKTEEKAPSVDQVAKL